MKRLLAALLTAALLCALAAGCAETQEATSSTGGEPVEKPMVLERLRVEFAATGAPETLMALAGRMPEQLQNALWETGVSVETVEVTIGASAASTVQAVTQGGVDLAFLPAEGYVAAGAGGVPLLADADVRPQEKLPLDTLPGRQAQICTAPTDYGQSLARRTAFGGKLTWEELDRARWGVLEEDSALGHRYVSLWLADHYEGSDLRDLQQVETYRSFEALLRAAAAGEIDLFPCTQTALEEWATVWTMDATRTDDGGRRGFGRETPLSDEVAQAGTMERCLTDLAVVRQEETLASPTFAAALSAALNRLLAEGDLTALTGCAAYAPLGSVTLDPVRRLLTMEGVAQ